MADFTALIVDDDYLSRDSFVECLSDTGIESRAFETAEELLAHLFPTPVVDLELMPDLVIIDMQLKVKYMQGLDLIRELVSPRRNIPSSLMVVTGHFPHADFVDEILNYGTAIVLPKPFGGEFCQKAKRLADIGKRRRINQIKNVQNRLNPMDDSRKHRPVFISYAHKEEMLANGIRIHIESLGIDVWYGPTTIDPGARWLPEITAGVDNVYIFIPIITDNYLSSRVCITEFKRFMHRMKSKEHGNLLLLPIIGNLSPPGRNHEIFKSISGKYHYIEFYPRTLDGLTCLTSALQLHIARFGGSSGGSILNGR